MPGDRIPPQSEEAEKFVLGTCLIDGAALDMAIDKLHEDDFYSRKHQRLFAVMKDMVTTGRQVDIVTIQSVLDEKGLKKELFDLIIDLSEAVSAIESIENYCNIILDKSITRKLLQVSREIADACYKSENILDLIESCENKVLLAAERRNTTEIKTAKDMMSITVSEMDRVAHGGRIGITTGFKQLDEIVGGYEKGQFIVLAGRTSMGKSACCLSMIANQTLIHKIPTALFSLEMPAVSLGQRLLSIESGIGLWNIRKAKMSKEYFEVIGDKMGKIAESPLYLDDNSGLTISRLRSTLRRMINKYGVEQAYIDHLHLMNYEGNDPTYGTSMISKGLQQTARDFNIPIIGLSQLNRADKKSKVHRPVLGDLRQSGCLGGDTLIYCQSLERRIRIKDLIYHKKFTILSNKGDNMEKESKKCWRTGSKQIYKIKLSNYQEISATENHKFLSVDGWKPVSELSTTDKIAIPIGFSHLVESTKIPIGEIRFIGHMLCNGSAVPRQPIHYTSNILDQDLCDQVIDDIFSVLGDKILPRKKDTVLPKTKFTCVYFKTSTPVGVGRLSPVADIMRKYELFGVRSKQKFIPEPLHFLPFYETCQLLKALFSGDGTVFYTEKHNRKSLKISYSSASIRLINDIQSLLASVGIVSFISKVTNKKDQTWYNLYLSGKSNNELFYKYIGFFNKRKQDILEDGWNKSKDNLAGWNTYNFNEERTLCFMPVKTIEKGGVEDVYDIEVPDSHCFMANGILAHNSIEQDAAMVIFVHREHYYTKDDADKGFAEIIVEKQRNGPLDFVKMGWKWDCAKFYELEDQPEERW
jgi:replicative DNA helicase